MSDNFRLGSWVVQPSLNNIERDGKTTHLEPKMVEVLVYLAEHPREVVSKEQLIRRVWGDTFVTDDVLTRCISELRRALEDDAKEPRVIQTIPKRGYRLLVKVDRPEENQLAPLLTTPKPTPGYRAGWLAVGMVILAIGALYLLRSHLSRQPAPSGRVMLAVLPFENLSADPEQEYFSDGMTEEMITQLGALDPQSLALIGRTSVMRYRHTTKAIEEIGRELHATHLLTGSVRHSGERLRITAQLVQVRDQTSIWTGTYDRNLRDVFVIQSDVARGIAQSIRIQLRPEHESSSAATTQVNPEAHTLYLKGRYFWNKYDAEGVTKAVEYFKRAVEVDPSYAPAYAALANVYIDIGNGHGPADLLPRDAYAKSQAAATQALQIDSELSEAHAALANLEYSFSWDWAAAETEFKKAIRGNPNNPSFRDGYAFLLATVGRFDDAIAQMQKAGELDPLSPMITADVGVIYAMAHRYEEALPQFRKSLELDPNFAPAMWVAGQVFLRQGKISDAIEMFERARRVLNNASSNVFLAYAYAVAGQRQKARQISSELQHKHVNVRNMQKAILLAALDQRHDALGALQAAYEERDPLFSYFPWVSDPFFSSLRKEPQFVELVRRLNLPAGLQ